MSSKRILVAEDDALMRNLYSSLIETYMSEYDSLIVDDGQAALDVVESGEDFDVIITDMSMPNLSGLGLYDRVIDMCLTTGRSEPSFIFVSGVQKALDSVNDVSEERGYTQLHKPFTVEKLKEAIDEACK